MTKFVWNRVNPNAPSDRSDFIVEWCKDLWNPENKQGVGSLLRSDGHACCLGRACIVGGLKRTFSSEYKSYYFEEERGLLPESLVKFLKFSDCNGMVMGSSIFRDKKCIEQTEKVIKELKDNTCLSEANDSKISFYTIGRVLSSYPRSFFRNLTHKEYEYILSAQQFRPKWEDYREARKEARCKAREDKRNSQKQVQV